jgi:hypothetical protein
MILALSKKCPERVGKGAILRGQSGMATGTVMLIAVLMASVAMSILTLNSLNSGRDIRYALFHSMLDVININLYAFGQNQRAWKSTLAYNYARTPRKMACIKEDTLCQWNVYEDIVLRYPTDTDKGSPYYDQEKSIDKTRDGFRLDGTVCNYDDTATEEKNERIRDKGCIITVRVRWRPFCISDCKIGLYNKITFDLTYRTPRFDENGYYVNERNFFLPAYPGKLTGPMPLYNPFR